MDPYQDLDAIPSATPRGTFPYGDVDEAKVMRAVVTLAGLEGTTGEEARSVAGTSLAHAGKTDAWAGDALTDEGMDMFFEYWAQATCQGRDRSFTLARQIFYMTIGFAREFLPVLVGDFSDEVAHMATLDCERIRMWSDDAWHAMQGSHNNVHGVMAPFCKLMSQWYGEGREDRWLLIEAITVLPYMLSSMVAPFAYCDGIRATATTPIYT